MLVTSQILQTKVYIILFYSSCDSETYEYLHKYETKPRLQYIDKKMRIAYTIWQMAEFRDSYDLYKKYVDYVSGKHNGR